MIRLCEAKSPRRVKIHDTIRRSLNPRFWKGTKLDPEVRKILLNVAAEFEKTLENSSIEIQDVIFTGSNANYTWTEYSDVDVHLIADVTKKDSSGEVVDVQDYLNTKRLLWSKDHELTIKGATIELYVQLADEDLEATAVYSLTLDRWIEKPSRKEFDRSRVDRWDAKCKAAKLMDEIDDLVGSDSATLKSVDGLVSRIWKMRKHGLTQYGEFSTENLAFKALRNSGYIKKLLTKQLDMVNKEILRLGN